MRKRSRLSTAKALWKIEIDPLPEIRCNIFMMAWLKRLYPNITLEWWEKWRSDVYEKEMDRLWPSIGKRKEQLRSKRRKMTTLKAKDVLKALKAHPATTAMLAKELEAHPKAIDGHMTRLMKKGLIVRAQWGVYEIATKTNRDIEPVRRAKKGDHGIVEAA